MKQTVAAVRREKLKSFQYKLRFMLKVQEEEVMRCYSQPYVRVSECGKRQRLCFLMPITDAERVIADLPAEVPEKRLWEEGLKWVVDAEKPVKPLDK